MLCRTYYFPIFKYGPETWTRTRQIKQNSVRILLCAPYLYELTVRQHV
jgi:hypothetical protein